MEVLGNNLDVENDSDNAKNGVGKTSLVNAISYALYGSAISNVKKSNLINKTNKRNMVVTLTFEKDETEYRIERGRSPTFLKFFINNTEQEITDESHGDSRKTQEFIESLLGMSHDMFKIIAALNTYSEPFLSMRAADQRAIIEQLLGVTKLSEKAEALKQKIKETKDRIANEETRIGAITESNNRIENTIRNLKTRQAAWKTSHDKEIQSLNDSLKVLQHIDINQELELHQKKEEIVKHNAEISAINEKLRTTRQQMNNNAVVYERLTAEIEKLGKSVCHTCGQSIDEHDQEKFIKDKQLEIDTVQSLIESDYSLIQEMETQLKTKGKEQPVPDVFYPTAKEAYDHRSNVEKIQSTLEHKQKETDPYVEQISELEKTALQEVDWSVINTLSKYKEHQEFLLKLLTNKDSFIRKKIIDQSLAFLNNRLTYYLSELGLPHTVSFQNDLSVIISILGQDYDFDNLSRGERNRLILGLSFAFRDVWEGLQHTLNLLVIDELLDNGLDGSGIEDALAVLKKISRDRKKNVFLISHRAELVGRVNNTLTVVKQNGFTSFESME